ncbi:MAG: SOS response-associated peptidase [Rhodovibrionaceae bacterium]|nr:SOS response-associated peptidase [Rhodovibrionaceae bacterium]
MCGRYSITSPPEAVRAFFGFVEETNLQPRYNVAPTQEVPAVRLGEDGKRHLVQLRWGLVPFWADDLSIGNRMINARSEKVASSPAFRHAFSRRRCLIVADGFYEWQPRAKGPKQPYRAVISEGTPMGLAGLWESWREPESGEAVESCTIITTDANDLLAQIHPRMPVIVPQEAFETWLDVSVDKQRALDLLQPFPSRLMRAYPVSRDVNKVGNDAPDLIEPVGEGIGQSDADEKPASGSAEDDEPRLL